MAMIEPPARAPGRPRNEIADRRIIEATLRLLSTEGYDRTSIESVAAEAHVTRATVYRRYPTKADMVTAAVCTMAGPGEPCECPDLRTTLVELLRGFHAAVGPSDGISIAASLYLQRHDHPEMLESFRETVTKPCRLKMAAVVQLSRDKGEIHPDTDPEAIVEMLIGSYLYRTFAGVPIPDDWPEQAVAAVWRGLEPQSGTDPERRP